MKVLFKKTDELISKLHKLLAYQQKLEADLLTKDEKIKDLTNQVKEKNDRAKELELLVASLRSAGGVALSDDQSKDTRQKINELIREVDKCIATLTSE